MPKDDWAKYARRDKGRRAVASGEFFRAGKESNRAIIKSGPLHKGIPPWPGFT